MKMVFEAEDKDPKAYNFRVNGKIEQVINTLFSAVGWLLVSNAREGVTEKELADCACKRIKTNVHEEALHKRAEKEGTAHETTKPIA